MCTFLNNHFAVPGEESQRTRRSAHLFRSTQNWPHLRNARCSVPKNLLSLSKRRPQTDIFDVACNSECGRQFSYRPNLHVCCKVAQKNTKLLALQTEYRNELRVLDGFEKILSSIVLRVDCHFSTFISTFGRIEINAIESKKAE